MPVKPREKWDSIEQYIEYIRHLSAYVLLAKPFVSNKSLLEIGCGTGYGAALLSETAKNMTAIDLSKSLIEECKIKYNKDNLAYMVADGLKLPFKDNSFDVVFTFQVIEHIEPDVVLSFIKEVERVLKNNGVFLTSTPNRRLRLLPFQTPWNKEHKKEYNRREFGNLLRKVFKQVEVYGLRCSDEIFEIERNRVYQSPMRFYLVRPIYNALNYVLPKLTAILLEKITPYFPKRQVQPSYNNLEGNMDKFSLHDFALDKVCTKDALDLMGICKKVKSL